MSPDDLQKSGLPTAFATTKVAKRTERNRKKKAQKKGKRSGKRDAHGKVAYEDQQYNYAEEFKVNEVLSEYRKEFTILMPKADRFKAEEEEYEESDFINDSYQSTEQSAECTEYDAYEQTIELDYGFDDPQSVSNSSDPSIPVTPVVPVKPVLHKYYHQRYDYFSLFDSGIQIDEEGWYSVTPEAIAHHIATEAHAIALTNKSSAITVIVDAFCGVGGNTIQFAKYFDKVIAIDLDAGRLEMARHNATIYGVADRIEFIHGDVFDILKSIGDIKPDLVFMSPPWGGPDYVNQPVFCPRAHLLDDRGQELFNLARKVSKNLVLFLPRQSNIYTVAEMLKDEKGTKLSDSESFVVEQHWLKNRLKAISIYFY